MATSPTIRVESTARHQAASRFWMILAFLSIYIIWGSTYLAIRYAVETIPPLVTAGIRHTFAGLVLLGICWSRGYRPRRQHWTAGLVLGGLFFLIGHGSLHWAEQYISSGFAALLVATEPLWILLLGAAMKQQKINWQNGLGLLLGLIGVTVLTVQDFQQRTTLTIGVISVLVGAVAWAIGVCISPRLRLPQDAIPRAAVPLVCGASMLLLTSVVSGEFSALRWSAVSLRSLLGLSYLIIFGSVLAFTAYTWLLQHCSPTLVATHTFVNPLVAVLLGWWWASEPLTLRMGIATGVILLSIVLVQQGERVAQLHAEPIQSE